MKISPVMILVAALIAANLPQAASARLDMDGKPPTIGKVVEFLGKMLMKSKSEGEAEQEVFGKFKCYCDDNEKSKSSEVKQLSEDISKLGSEIEGAQSENGELSVQCAKLKTDISDNLDSQSQAKGIRSKASKDFLAEKADLSKGIRQMEQAIRMLSAVGADQTQSSGADHAKFMAGYKKKSASFLKLGVDVKHALEAAAALVPDSQRSTFDSFLQAPFTGSYSSQSAGVVGILKSMRDTYDSNLKSAIDVENSDAKAHAALMKNLKEVEKEMKRAYDDKQEDLGANDSELAAKKLQLKSAKEGKDSATDFLDTLRPMCKKKTKQFEARNMLRANEEASIAEAIALLGSDSAFTVFAGSDDGDSLMQVHTERRASPIAIWLQAHKLLQGAALHDARLAKLSDLMRGSNPFSVVLGEVDKMVVLLEKEQDSDEENHSFCKQETGSGKKKLRETQDEIDKIEDAMSKLDDTINKAQTGLKAQDAALETAMEENVANQKKETAMRKQENLLYQKDVAQLVKAEALLGKAIKVLQKFYSSLDEKSGLGEGALLQDQAGPKPPSTWSGAYEGQSKDAGEKGAVGMLQFILSETEKQNTAAHKSESEAQEEYEDSMAKLTTEQKDQEKNVVQIKSAMAKAEQAMIDKKGDHKQSRKDKKATEAYLKDIKPGCDFIFENFKLRTKNRKIETSALQKAKKLLKGSPAYQAAKAEAEAASLGACKSKCKAPGHVKCKACLASVSIPGYCAGHAGTPGC